MGLSAKSVPALRQHDPRSNWVACASIAIASLAIALLAIALLGISPRYNRQMGSAPLARSLSNLTLPASIVTNTMPYRTSPGAIMHYLMTFTPMETIPLQGEWVSRRVSLPESSAQRSSVSTFLMAIQR